MKKILLETSFSKIYIVVMLLISTLVIGGYFSYAMFTVTKEKKNAISIVTGNLTYELLVDGENGNTLTVPAGTTKEFVVTLNNPNNRKARFNFYYKESLPNNVTAGYIIDENINILPPIEGINLEKSGSSGYSNIYKILVRNEASSSITINLGVEVGLDYNDLTLPSNGHLFEEFCIPVNKAVLTNLGNKGSAYNDGTDTFITGEEPNNYIWYSGKLWRAVSVNNSAKTTKLITQWAISTIPYSTDNSAFKGSHMEAWLNDTTVDGFLGNLRDYENFIVTDAKWNATLDATALGSIPKPKETTIVTDAVGLLNMYEYQTSYRETNYSNGYLNNGLWWWTLTPYSSSNVRLVSNNGNAHNASSAFACGVRPSVKLKSNVQIVDGDGTIENPYRLKEDNDKDLIGAKLSSRYSGEYIHFGTGENKLYRIVSHESEGLTKITSAEPLKDSGTFKTIGFGSNVTYSSTNTIGTFLNGSYLTNYVGSNYGTMIEDNTIWYLGTVGEGRSYKLAKYKDINMSSLMGSTTNSKVGLLRLGELMSGQFDRYGNNTNYWTLTPYSTSNVRVVLNDGDAYYYSPPDAYGTRPTLNLKSNVIITSGEGTKEKPFEIALSS